MDLKVFWTDAAIEKLEEIFEYYKVIYWIEEPYVKIATVFDCRQNPVKMKRI
jgi:plasmid stabilization system protein ParE